MTPRELKLCSIRSNLADALESDRFKQFLDHVPVAIAVSELHPSETVTYANLEFERLTGQPVAEIQGKSWRALPGIAASAGDDRMLRDAVKDDAEYIGQFTIDREAGSVNVDAWSNTIEDETGKPIFRLLALASVSRAGCCRTRAVQKHCKTMISSPGASTPRQKQSADDYGLDPVRGAQRPRRRNWETLR